MLCYAVTAYREQRQKLDLSRASRLFDLMLFGLDQFPDHGMNFDSGKPFFIHWLFFCDRSEKGS
jgi:hypothetical protein